MGEAVVDKILMAGQFYEPGMHIYANTLLLQPNDLHQFLAVFHRCLKPIISITSLSPSTNTHANNDYEFSYKYLNKLLLCCSKRKQLLHDCS